MRVSRGLPFLLSAWLLPGVEARAQDVGPYLPTSGFNQGEFRFGTTARTSLRTLWQVSAGARQERVACIGGYRFEGVTFITRVEPVIASSADSMSVAAAASLLQCRPPEWLGTIHTHVATKDGQPYVTFSGADRGVMMRWESIWQSSGVFCVLFDDRRAHCEAGHDSSGDAFYAYSRGNNLGL